MTSGPTQNYDAASPAAWRARPLLAVAVRTAVVAGPLVLALVVGLVAALWLPPARVGVPGWLWLASVVVLTSVVLLLASRWLRRLAPLSALLRLSLVLPDDVPHRFGLARRRWSPAALAEGSRTGPAEGAGATQAERLLGLVGSLADHDDRTRAHGERVQAYAALIGREMGLAPADVDRLSWVALLHDVGKLHVPAEVINKAGRPSDEEWAQLQQHPHHGGELVEPLRGWLGGWLDGVEQHHERWDGRGYPRSLAGEEISLAARIIAVADTYDVITSARSYKKPLSAEQARAEITRCAGEQFDPSVVRALLGVGIGRLRRVAGPATLLAALPAGLAAPAQAAQAATAAVQVAGGHALTAVVVAAAGVGGAATAAEALDLPAAVAAASTTSSTSSTTTAAGAPLAGAPAEAGGAGTPSAPGEQGLPGTPDPGTTPASAAAAGGSGAPVVPSTPGAAAGVTPGAQPGAAGAVPQPQPTPPVAPVGSAQVPSAAASSAASSAAARSSTSGSGLAPKLPVLPTRVPLPSVSLPPVTVPSVAVPSVSLPPVPVPLPSVTVPRVSVPGVTVPGVSVPGVSVPGVTVPPVVVPSAVPTALPTSLPRVSVPPLLGR